MKYLHHNYFGNTYTRFMNKASTFGLLKTSIKYVNIDVQLEAFNLLTQMSKILENINVFENQLIF